MLSEDKDSSTHQHERPYNVDTLTGLRDSLGDTNGAMIDELSQLKAEWISDLSTSYQILRNDFKHAFGLLEIKILAGDYHQLSCIPETASIPYQVDVNLLQTVSANNIGHAYDKGDPRIIGAELLTGSECHFKLRKLTDNMRIKDPLLLEIVEHLSANTTDARLSLETCRFLQQHYTLTASWRYSHRGLSDPGSRTPEGIRVVKSALIS